MHDVGTILESAGAWPYLLLFVLAAAESSAFVGLVVPGETFVIGAGVAASSGSLEPSWLIVAVVAGAIGGDSIGYALGRRLGVAGGGQRFTRAWSTGNRERVQRFIDRRGPSAVFWGRFVGVLRPLVPLAAGAGGMRYRSFFVFNVAGAAIWGTGTILIGFFLGPRAHEVMGAVGWVGGGLVVAILIVIIGRYLRRRRVVQAIT